MTVIIFLAAFVASCSASVCKSISTSDNLQALDASFQSHQNYALFGQLSACPRINEDLLDSLRFVIIPQKGIDVVLLNEHVGDFMFLPAPDEVGIISFFYYVEDAEGRSEPGRVTIGIQPQTLSVDDAKHVIGLEDSDTELDIQIDDVQDDHSHELSVIICSCANDVTCNAEHVCHCHLSLPDGWQIFNDQRELTLEELKSLSTNDAGNLILRASTSSAAKHCLDVHVIEPLNEGNPSLYKRTLNIHIHPLHTVFTKPQYFISEERPSAPIPEMRTSGSVNVTTSQGRPFVFSDLGVVNVDGMEGTYMVSLHLDHGGLLWVRQDLRQDVIFLPLTEEIHPEGISADKVYQLLHRFGTFRSGDRPFDLEVNNNGVRLMTFIGSLEGINEVLSTLTFVPWCSDWPLPPSWPVPAKSWMNVPLRSSDDIYRPHIWPQWYPRFWYPFPTHHWTWWPRVLPPWWISSSCSNSTSTLRMRVEAVPASLTCTRSHDVHTVSEWTARIKVNASGKSPKSLVTVNHFTYFEPDSRAVTIDTVHLRFAKYFFGESIAINLTLLESNYATVEFPSTGLDHTHCGNIEECNEQLTHIKVTFKDGVKDVCLVTLKIDMYQGESSHLLDTLVVWVVNTTRQCADIRATHPGFELMPRRDIIQVKQGSVDQPIRINSNVRVNDVHNAQSGILHVKLYAEYGIITMKVPDGIRIYSDHMGQHEGIASYLCIAGPVPMVLEALAATRFTPFEPLTGEVTVKVDYRMPSTASQLLYQTVQPFRRTEVRIRIVGNVLPYMPVILHPQKMCISESSSLSLNQTTILRRFKDDERVMLVVRAERGSIVIDTSHKQMYDCPVQEEPLMDEPLNDECHDHLDCPNNLLCCFDGSLRSSHRKVQSMQKTCSTPAADLLQTKKAMVSLLSTGQPYMNGFSKDINEMISLNVLNYEPAPCVEAEDYTDNIEIRVLTPRNPEGDDVRAKIPIQVTCHILSYQVEDLVDNCEWNSWSSCITGRHACGLGSQYRYQLCNTQHLTEQRPCLNCTCIPVPSTIPVEGCPHQLEGLRCPKDCSVDMYHLETMQCQQTSTGQTQEIPTQVSIDVHDSCVCDYCKRDF